MVLRQRQRVSQRAPKACQECTRRKIRCDKTVPCSRCRRLKKTCSREDVLTTKVAARNVRNGDEATFLRRLRRILADDGSTEDAQVLVEKRLYEVAEGAVQDASEKTEEAALKEAPADASLAVRTLESLVWSRQSTSCFPHRSGCRCAQHRGYAELASINCDMTSSMIQWTSVYVDPALYLTTANARKVVEFHIEHLWWHHNALHATTFLNQCSIFWGTGQVTHRMWLALYLSIISSTLWTLVNSRRHRRRVNIEFNENVIAKQFKELLRTLYTEDFMSDPSSIVYSIQAIAISTRYAHNIGFSDSITNLLASAVGLAQAMGLHRIKSAEADDQQSVVTPHERIELENGKRLWWQLVVQDYFAIPFTESYSISVADKVVMLHRPLLLQAFRTSALPDVKQTCLSAAVTILLEHGHATSTSEETPSVWTQSAFCTTATVVLGLELLYGQTGPDSKHHGYLTILRDASARLEKRRCDMMAIKCGRLIHAFLEAHDDLAVSEQLTPGRERVHLADNIIRDHRLMSQVVSVEATEADLKSDGLLSNWMLYNDISLGPEQFAFDFDAWYNQIFT
ncbi:Zn(2)-C6 fungal-type DNA-binding domain protein [Akanthomyces lecanii RCEF 1005]|uniref:Zn(2)-C6 fungal-type DNA-binding domain protein n=1 Tax=Akanthomyces lecanii RCEF 1005 TaxID=1081108 RepID=A0A168G2M7_CORDF|nr:Zn(2)-C6 fungal-type DNA-binding domain protein [Akanthomyces lecanii RCEF 1005]